MSRTAQHSRITAQCSTAQHTSSTALTEDSERAIQPDHKTARQKRVFHGAAQHIKARTAEHSKAQHSTASMAKHRTTQHSIEHSRAEYSISMHS